MNNEQQERRKQLHAGLDPKELLRLTRVLIAVQFIGIVLGFILRNLGVPLFFMGITFGILWLFPYWQPAYAIARKIAGNQNIPRVLSARQRKWWNYISIAIKVLMLLALFGLGLRLLFQ